MGIRYGVRMVRNENFDHEWNEWNDELTREVQSFHIANIAGQKAAVIQRRAKTEITNQTTQNGIIKLYDEPHQRKSFSPSRTKIYSQASATLIPQRKILELRHSVQPHKVCEGIVIRI